MTKCGKFTKRITTYQNEETYIGALKLTEKAKMYFDMSNQQQ